MQLYKGFLSENEEQSSGNDKKCKSGKDIVREAKPTLGNTS